MEIYNKLFTQLSDHDLILTPTQRLIAFLQKSYTTYHAHHKGMWSKPLMLTLEQWLTLMWEKQLIQHARFPFRLLTKNQEYFIWQSIIERVENPFLISDSIASTAQQAWQLHHHWQLDETAFPIQQTHESRVWKKWAKHFSSFCQQHACIDRVSASQRLLSLFQEKILTPPPRIFLIGFDEINPLFKKLFQILKQSHCQVSLFTAEYPEKPTPSRVVLANTENELETMARWAHQRWQTGKKNIVCVIPDLLEIRSQTLDTFTEVFTSLSKNTPNALPFNVAGGKKLNEFSLIHMALTILQIKTIHPFNKLSLFLRSPYLAYAEEEQAQRTQLEIYLRRYAENTISLEKLVGISQNQHCDQLSQLITNLIPLSRYHSTQTPSDWAKHFAKKLNAVGWPGHSHLLSETFQLLERWSALLREFSQLDFILGKINHETACHHLQHLLSESLFQAETPQDCPIHVLGPLDTAGLYLNKLWVMGLDDSTWPAAAHPNPFIPYALQRRYQLPHACNEREFYFSSLLTKRWLQSAEEIIFSHSSQRNEHPCRPSPLITTVPLIEINDLALTPYQTRSESIWETRRWEYYSDTFGPALQSHEWAIGGSQLFKQQAACPFQAFARFRLNAQSYPFPQSGLNAIDRGILLHHVIETFWNLMGDQATLLKQSDETLPLLIEEAIERCIQKFSQKRPFTFQTQFTHIERERLQQRLNQLIALEKQRPPFTKVIHEKKETLRFDKLTIDLRIDRLDELTDGSLFIIDYKTGIPKKYKWFDERLDEPQIPLYCLAHPPAKGFAVLHLRSNTLDVQGFGENKNGLSRLLSSNKDKTLPQTWNELLAFWNKSLTTLSQQYQKGFAKVDPKEGDNTCRLCHLKLLCRINHESH